MRPELDLNIDAEVFFNYYWLKEELYAFCKKYDLPRSGSKDELKQRIYTYIKCGKVISPQKKSSKKVESSNEPLTLESIIPEGYKNDEKHREFFKSVIGEHFKFNVPFMNWMKSNHGKNYKDAVDQWQKIVDEKKRGVKTEISSQFQYNQYTRDYFSDNPGATREDAIKCWKYKKSLPGHNRYEKSDLEILSKDYPLK